MAPPSAYDWGGASSYNVPIYSSFSAPIYSIATSSDIDSIVPATTADNLTPYTSIASTTLGSTASIASTLLTVTSPDPTSAGAGFYDAGLTISTQETPSPIITLYTPNAYATSTYESDSANDTATSTVDSLYPISTSSGMSSGNLTTAEVMQIMQNIQECKNVWITLDEHDQVVEENANSDPDIAGIGVIIAFLLTAYLTWLGALIAYLGGWIHKHSMGVLDEKFLGFLRVDLSRGQSDKIQRSIRNAVLICSDQQIITGIGILIALFTQMKTVSVYHYQVAVYLAWMSSNVHLTTLTILRDYLQKNRTLRFWRVISMLALMVLLVVALVPMVSKSWAWLTRSSGFAVRKNVPQCAASIPAKCFWSKEFRPEIDPDTIFSFVILGVLYAWKVCLLYEGGEKFLGKWLRAKPQYFLEKAVVSAAQQHTNPFAYNMRVGCYIYFVAFSDFFESFIATLWFVAISIVWGTLRAVTPREQVPQQVRQQEDKITFGQVLPIFLLFLPFMAITEVVFGEYPSPVSLLHIPPGVN